MHPRQVIFFVISNKCYIIYDADALIQWIHTQSQSEELSEETQDPYTRVPLAFNKIISATKPCILQYFKQKLGSVSTENRDTIHNHKS